MITTTTIAIPNGLISSISLLTILFLIGLLITKEISASIHTDRARRISRALTIALIPLAFLFVATLLFRLIAVLR